MHKKLLIGVFFLLFFSGIISAQTAEPMNASLTSLETIRDDIRRQALPVLVMFKQLESTALPRFQQRVKIIKSGVPIFTKMI